MSSQRRVDVPAPEPWSEQTDGDALAITFSGEDAARREAAALDARIARDRGSLHAPTTWRGAVKWLAWVALTLLGLPLLSRWVEADATEFRLRVVVPAVISVAVVGFFAWQMRTRPRPSFADRFRIDVDADDLTVSSLSSPGAGAVLARVALADVATVEGEARLVLVTMNGEHIELPCVLDDRERHPQLAARLAEAVARARAARGAFRGPRVARDEEGLPEETESDASSARRA